MRLAVLDLTGEMPDLFAGLPRASEQITTWLSPALPEAKFTRHDISGGAALPALAEFDGLIVSGSEFGVYDDTPWMTPLRVFLNDLRAARIPTFGICFGHQIMADTWGGRAEKAQVGKVVGARPFQMADQPANAYVWHQDQVTQVPPDAQILGQAAHCPVGALAYDFPAMSVQFHPEFTDTQLRAMFERGRDQILSGAEADDAVASFNRAPVDPTLMRAETGAFFRKHIAST